MKKCIRLEGDFFEEETKLLVFWSWNKLLVELDLLLYNYTSYWGCLKIDAVH